MVLRCAVGPSDVEQTSMGRELRFAGRLVKTVPDDWTCDHETPHPQRGPCSWY